MRAGTGEGSGECPTVAIIGGGASGTLSAMQLVRSAARTGRALRVLLLDPAPIGTGVAYSTRDPRHRLNVPATGMSAHPDDPGHFVRWLGQGASAGFEPSQFAARTDYGRYLAEVLQEAIAHAPGVDLQILRTRVQGVARSGRRWELSVADGSRWAADAVVLALGPGRPSTAWAPAALARSRRFVADPWADTADAADPAAPAPGPTGRVVLIGAGLTMADMAVRWADAGTRLDVVSRHGLLPISHAATPEPRPAAPELGDARTLAEVRALVFAQLRAARVEGRDWRTAIDSLRPSTSELWQRLSAADRVAFHESAARRWNRVRHRVEPGVGAWLQQQVDDGTLRSHRGSVLDAVETPDAILLRLSSGEQLAARVVVNCTGPANDVRHSEDPLVRGLLRAGTARPGPLGLGLDCDDDGRVLAAGGARRAIWTLGPLRQGQLWESTAVPEIRVQAAAVAAAVLTELADRPVSAPRLGGSVPVLAAAATSRRSAARSRSVLAGRATG